MIELTSCKDAARSLKRFVKSNIILFTQNKKISPPKLVIITLNNDEASERYVQGKLKDCEEVGAIAEIYRAQSLEDISTMIAKLNQDNSVHGIIIQHPLHYTDDSKMPDSIFYNLVNEIFPKKDVDGLTKHAIFYPCTPSAIQWYLLLNNIILEDKHIAIVGRSKLVGAPLAEMMKNANATVTTIHSGTPARVRHRILRSADIIISATGVKNLITKEDLVASHEQILIDVGINFNDEGKLCGDADPEIYNIDTLTYTPVPGGVGLLTRAMLLKHLLDLWIRQVL